jgi:hypothetical protein
MPLEVPRDGDDLLERLRACRDIIRHLEAGPDTANAKELLEVLRVTEGKMVQALADYRAPENN